MYGYQSSQRSEQSAPKVYRVFAARRGLDSVEELFQGSSICILQQHIIRPIPDKASVKANDVGIGFSATAES